MGEPRTWAVDLDVREDATSMFVPADVIPEANVGDRVVADAAASRGNEARAGRIVRVLDDPQRGRFLVVDFE